MSWSEYNEHTPKARCFTVSGSKLFVGQCCGRGIQISLDKGKTWNQINSGLISPGNINALLTSESHIFAGTTSGIFVSSDDGSSWQKINNELTNSEVVALVKSENSIYASTFNRSNPTSNIILSTDNGVTWRVVGGMNNAEVVSLFVFDSTLYAGTWTKGIWKRSIPEMNASSAISPNEEAAFALKQNHPNPFTTSTTISFILPELSVTTLDMCDMLGRKITTLANGIMETGSHSLQFEGSNLTVGAYIIRLTSAGKNREIKIVLGK